MSAQILTLLKFGLLALLYLFFVRVLFSVWSELRPTGKQRVREPEQAAPPAAVRRETVTAAPGAFDSAPATSAPAAAGVTGAVPATTLADPFASVTGKLVVIEPDNLAGMVYDLGSELTVGRAPGCAVILDDTFVSSLHARIYKRERAYVLEDLGSTNGTFLNGGRVTEPTVMQRADRVRFGSMLMELQ